MKFVSLKKRGRNESYLKTKQTLSFSKMYLQRFCSGPSMEPTIVSGEVLITKSVKLMNMDKIKRGDIVVARSPTHPGINICKRVAGLPGDKITHNRFFTVSIPPGHMWLEGDNSNNSTDSRTYGPIPQGLIRGKALCRIFPLSRVTCDFTYENKVR